MCFCFFFLYKWRCDQFRDRNAMEPPPDPLDPPDRSGHRPDPIGHGGCLRLQGFRRGSSAVQKGFLRSAPVRESAADWLVTFTAWSFSHRLRTGPVFQLGHWQPEAWGSKDHICTQTTSWGEIMESHSPISEFFNLIVELGSWQLRPTAADMKSFGRLQAVHWRRRGPRRPRRRRGTRHVVCGVLSPSHGGRGAEARSGEGQRPGPQHEVQIQKYRSLNENHNESV